MGWAAGSQLGCELYCMVRDYIPEEDRQKVAAAFYDAVCDLDADDWDGTSQLEIDAKIPLECWDCGKETTADQLEEGICKNCKENNG